MASMSSTAVEEVPAEPALPPLREDEVVLQVETVPAKPAEADEAKPAEADEAKPPETDVAKPAETDEAVPLLLEGTSGRRP